MRLAAALGVALATLAVMLATEPRLAIVWDEGYTLGREARLRTWFRALRDPQAFAATWTPPVEELVQQQGTPPPTRPDQVDTRSKLLFDARVLAWFWPFAREELERLGLPEPSDEDFDDIVPAGDLALFADLGLQPALVRKSPFFRGARISLVVNNLFASRVGVRDAAGMTPISYQPGYLDPLGRSIRISFRKLFF